MSDHSLLYYTLDLQKPLPPNSSKMTTDTNKLHAYLESIGKLEEKEQQQWYKNLPEAAPYDQLLDQTLKFQRNLRIRGKSKKWWDPDLKEKLKRVRQSARGGHGRQARTHNPQRWKKWKQEKSKMKRMIREKKRACWQRFLKEHGSKDPWEVVRMAKNPWERKERKKVLKTLEGEEIPESQQGAAMEKAHSLWDKTKLTKEWEPQGPGIERQELLTKVYTALSGTSNTSAPGPDGISYKTLKAANKTPLGRALMDQVAPQLAAGTVLREWQDSKVVFIPKPGKDHTQLKAWRTITLINCIGKLGEKVVAEELQQANLLHRHQFGSVKGRSAIDAVFREVTRVQQCLSNKGSAGWGLWDVKGGFQNVREQEVLKRMDKSKHGKQWKG